MIRSLLWHNVAFGRVTGTSTSGL